MKVGDIVCLPDDKYSAACYGYVIELRGKFAVVRWFDGLETEEEIDWLVWL